MKQKLIQLADNIWLWPHNPNPTKIQCSVGIVVGGNESVLIDAGNSPRLAHQIKAELERCGLPAVSRIIYTHHHWDHVYGACAFEIPVVAHTKCKAVLNEEAKKPWSSEYLRQEIKRNPKLKVSYKARDRAIEDWASFRIIVPEAVFEKTETIHLDKVTIELEHVGGKHAQDSIVVKIPQARVMFLGDCYYPPPLHLRKSGVRPSFDMLASLESEAYELYIEGHDEPFTRAELLKPLGSR